MPPPRSDPPTGPVNTSLLTEAERHRLLASARRRRVIGLLADSWTPIGLEALAEALLAREEGAGGSADADVEKIEIALHHVHLPMLSESGVIEYDPASRRISGPRVTEDLLSR